MQPVARAFQYLADRSNQDTARANAAQAHAILAERRRDRDEVNDYLRARLTAYGGAGWGQDEPRWR